MNRYKFLLIFLLWPLTFFGQSKEIALTYLSRWDNDNLPRAGSQTFADIWGWTSPNGREYAIIGSLDSIFFIEVTDPYHPIVRARQAGKYNECGHREFKSYQNYCYAVADEGNSTLQIFDMKYLPDSVHKVYDSDSLCSKSHSLFIEKDRLYLIDHKKVIFDSLGADIIIWPLSVFSLQNPEEPKLLSHLKPPIINGEPAFGRSHDAFVKNDTVYLSVGNNGLYIYDYRDPVNPKIIQTILPPYPESGYNHSSWMTPDGKTLVIADETHYKRLKSYDISTLKKQPTKEPEFLALFGLNAHFNSIPHNPFIKGDYVYVSYYHDGVAVFNIHDPENPYFVTSYDTYYQNDNKCSKTDTLCLRQTHMGFEGCWGVYPFFPSGTIVASDMTNGLYVMRLDTFNVYPEKLHITVGPNPFHDHITLNVGFNEASEFNFTLYDLLGRPVLEKTVAFPRGDNKYDLNMSNIYTTGLYILQARSQTEKYTFKLYSY